MVGKELEVRVDVDMVYAEGQRSGRTPTEILHILESGSMAQNSEPYWKHRHIDLSRQ